MIWFNSSLLLVLILTKMNLLGFPNTSSFVEAKELVIETRKLQRRQKFAYSKFNSSKKVFLNADARGKYIYLVMILWSWPVFSDKKARRSQDEKLRMTDMYMRGKIKLVTRPSNFGNLFLPRQPFYSTGQFDLHWCNAITLYYSVGSARIWTMTNACNMYRPCWPVFSNFLW